MRKRVLSIKAGGFYAPPTSLQKIWGFLRNYHILIDGKELKTFQDMNNYYSNFDKWEILYPNGGAVNKRDRNSIAQKIEQNIDNEIEDQWSTQLENDWARIRDQLFKSIIQIKAGAPFTLTTNEAETLMKYLVMYNWRSLKGNRYLRQVWETVDDMLEPSSDSEYEELKRGFLLKAYYEFQKGFGVIKETLKIYCKEFTFAFLISSGENHFITSDNPSFDYVDKEGKIQHIFVVLPNMIATLVRKNPQQPTSYIIRAASTDDVTNYNKKIFDNCGLALSKRPLAEYGL